MAGLIQNAQTKALQPPPPMDAGGFINNAAGITRGAAPAFDPDSARTNGPAGLPADGAMVDPTATKADPGAGANLPAGGALGNVPMGKSAPVGFDPGDRGMVDNPAGGVQHPFAGPPSLPGSPTPPSPYAGTPTLPGSPGPTSTPSPFSGPPSLPGSPGPATPPPAGGAPGTGTTPPPAVPASAPTGTPPDPGSAGSTAWTPTSGIVGDITGITPQAVTGTGYTATDIAATPAATSTGYNATGYTAAQGTAQGSDENVSSAVDRIINENSPIMQQAKAGAMDTANSRGLLNSSMAAGAGQSAVLSAALPMAQGDVANAQFNAQQANVMTINNVNQANAASAFHADAINQASQFAAAARNSASQFNSAQAQQKAEFAAQQWDAAAAFSAQAKQAADTFNASAYNDAMQRYVDAKNAATAAQNDAENLARRDTAQINAGLEQAHIGADATVGAAAQHAAATVAAAQIGAAASTANTEASLANQRYMQTQSLNEDMSKFGTQMSQQQAQWAANLSATQFDTFQNGLTGIMTSALEPDAKQNAIGNYLALWTASGTLPIDIKPPGT